MTEHKRLRIDSEIFKRVSDLITEEDIKLMNSSPLFMSLLNQFGDKGEIHLSDKKNAYNGDKIIWMKETGHDFVRVLGHELGHYYDWRTDTEDQKLKDEAYIINQEMKEARATATSFIIRRQIMSQMDIDTGISNRIYMTDPRIITRLENQFYDRIDDTLTIENFWPLVQEIAPEIWGKNFFLKPRCTSRWQNLLENTYGDDPEDLPLHFKNWKSLVSAEMNCSGDKDLYTFTFYRPVDEEGNCSAVFDESGELIAC